LKTSGTDNDRLIDRSKRGDQEAFRELVEAHQSYAYRLAFRLLPNEDEATDVVQEAFIRVWRHLGRFRPGTRFQTWLFRIVTNLAYDRLRAGRRRERAMESFAVDGADRSEGRLEARISDQEMAERIAELTDDLPPRQRITFVLRDLHDLSVAEVAAITGMASGTVKANLSYARRRIRERLVSETANGDRTRQASREEGSE